MNKIILFILILIVIAGAALLFWPLPETNSPPNTRLTRASVTVEISPDLKQATSSQGLLSWLGIRGPSALSHPKIGTAFANIVSTGYASNPSQTDFSSPESPCITASGKWVRPGTVASNFLPLGTILEIKKNGQPIPGRFIVEDRMAARFSNRIDIWFAQTSQALDFGKQHIEITVVGYGKPGQSLVPEEKPHTLATAANLTFWEAVTLRARAIAELITARGTGVNRYDIDCLALQQKELGV